MTNQTSPNEFDDLIRGALAVEKGDAVPVASDVYERQAFDAEGVGGSVNSDILGMTTAEMEDYFGDLDPVAFL